MSGMPRIVVDDRMSIVAGQITGTSFLSLRNLGHRRSTQMLLAYWHYL